MKHITKTQIFDAIPTGSSDSVVAFSVGLGDEVLILMAGKELDLRKEKGGGSFFKSRPDKPQNYILSVWRNNENTEVIEIKEEKYNITEVQSLNGNYLLVCPRCSRKSDLDIEKNARVYDSSGKLVKELILGDGIENVMVTADQEIWVSYFDEGIFGNYGWDEPLGKSGLVNWSQDGEIVYEYKPGPDLDYMADCYAMNIGDEGDLWCCYYTDFPIVRIRNGEVVGSWQSPVSSSSWLSISYPYVVLSGSSEDYEECHLVKLEDKGKAKIVETFRFCTAKREPLKIDRMAARGSKLYYLAKGSVYCVDVSELIASAA